MYFPFKASSEIQGRKLACIQSSRQAVKILLVRPLFPGSVLINQLGAREVFVCWMIKSIYRPYF